MFGLIVLLRLLYFAHQLRTSAPIDLTEWRIARNSDPGAGHWSGYDNSGLEWKDKLHEAPAQMEEISHQLVKFSFTFAPPSGTTSPSPPDPEICHFDKLPLEIVSWIMYWVLFDNFAAPQYGPTSLRQHRSLACVCRTWRDAVLGTPYLWCFITSTNLLERRLSLSKTLPLDIDLYLGDIRSGNRALRVLDQIQPLSEHRNRWKRLSVSGAIGVLKFFVQCLEEKGSTLEHLSLTCDAPDTLDLTRIEASLLQSLEVCAHGSQLSVEVLTNLHFLHLSSHCFAATDILSLLFNCSSLTDLKLSHISLRYVPSDQNTDLIPVTLRRLESLKIICSARSVLIPLLQAVNIAGLRFFHFDGETRRDLAARPPLPHEILWDNDQIPGLIVSVLGNRVGFPLLLSARRGILRIVADDAFRFEAGYPPRDVYTVLSKASTVLPLDCARITLEFDPGFGQPDLWIKMLGKLRPVTLHGIVYGVDNLDWLCKLLGQSASACPYLESLTILPEGVPVSSAIFKRDLEFVIRSMLRNGRRLSVELGEHEVFNPLIGKFQKRGEESSGGVSAADHDHWRFEL